MPNEYPYQDQQQQQQFYNPQYGQSHDEGTIEETIHRTASKRVNHSRTPVREIFERPGLSGKVAVIFGVAGIVLAAAALTFTFMSRSSADAQLSQMRDQLTSMSQQFQNSQHANAGSYTGLSGKVNALSTAMSTWNGTWNLTCAQALESQDGPGTYYFPCSNVKP
jgi:hypothetical protein